MDNPKIKFVHSISDVDQSQYEQLIDSDYPFIQYNFLKALESSGAVGESSGWNSSHLLITENDRLITFVPLYIKMHSYGEYVFDFEWAKAYQDNRLGYYPKLVTAIPFMPVSGCRICHHPNYTIEQIVPVITQAIKQLANDLGASSWHILFPEESIQKNLTACGLLSRSGVQFHWFNKNYQNFDDFLISLNSKRRKDIRRERKKIAEQKIVISILQGKDVDTELWQQFHQFYQLTYAKRSSHGGYLPTSFFTEIGRLMPENIVLIVTHDGDKLVAAALFFKDSDTLYGRYWGCNREYDFLHFECCYYQGIEYCINNNLQRFDAGAQGEHKIQRGFEPVETYSSHWIEHDEFNRAIDHFLKQEKLYTENYLLACREKSPFKHSKKKSES